MSLTVKVIPANAIYHYWDSIAPFFQSAIDQAKVTEYSVEQMKVYLISGQWVTVGFFDEQNIPQGALALTFSNYPNYRVAFVSAIGGKSLADVDNLEQLKQICKNYGASKIQGLARESVARLWKQKLGFTERSIIVETDI